MGNRKSRQHKNGTKVNIGMFVVTDIFRKEIMFDVMLGL